jgi:hypothetical protein
MDIFKLIYEHDLRLDALRERHLNRSEQETSSSLEDFLKPDPTYSKFYITGTDLANEQFGLNCLKSYQKVSEALEFALNGKHLFWNGGEVSLDQFLVDAAIGDPLIISDQNECIWNIEKLQINDGNNVGHIKSEIAEVLKSDDYILYKEKAHQGFDLHLFSKMNIYESIFYPLQKLVGDDFRFFSINGKRIRSERKFYFETWTLHRPPHGAEEVFKETVL